MDRPIIVLVDNDEKYLMPLELKLIEEFEDYADINVITDIDYLKIFFSSPRKVDILVINEDLYSTEFEKHNITNTFILTESNVLENTEDINYKKIYKYTSIKKIFSTIVDVASLNEMQSKSNEDRTQVCMVYSPIGGIGKTTVAMGISAALSRFHKKVLYINTETIQSFNFILKDKSYCSNGFEKQLALQSENIIDYMKGALGNELFSYILPFKQATSSLNIKIENYKYLLDKLKASRLFDFIILDTSNDFSNEKAMLMGFSDKVVILSGQDYASSIKMESLLRNIDCSDEKKFIFVCNNYNSAEENRLIKNKAVSSNITEYIEFIRHGITDISIELLSNNEHFQKLAYIFI